MEKTLFFNGKIFTGDGFTHSMLVEDQMILATGDMAVLRGAGALAVDLLGKTVIPGLNDSHNHLFGVGKNITSVQLLESKSIDEIIERTKTFIEKNNVADGAFITGRGWNQDYFEGEKRLPNRHDLDKISKTHPIILRRACGHLLVCNTLALEMAKVDQNTIANDGGQIDKDANGFPTGIFREHALSQVEGIIPQPTAEEMAEIIQKAQAYAASFGITSIQTNDINDGNFAEMDKAYKMVVESGNAKTRITMQSCFNSIDGFKKYLDAGFRMGNGKTPYKIGPLKLFVDGSLGGRTALMKKPYADDNSTFGIECMNQQTLNEFHRLASQADMQVITHAIGDKAIEMVIDAIEQEGGRGNPHRHGIVHVQITDQRQIERMKELDILAFVQPIFLHYDMHVVADRVGKELADTSYAFGTMHKNGIHTSFGTDSPVEAIQPFENLHCAINRQDLKYFPENGYQPDECFSVEDAINCYSRDGAYASFEEYEKGTLSFGMFADFAILDRDIFTIDKKDIKNVKVEKTYMGGKLTYEM